MNTKIRLVALDMDGTLLDSQKRLPKDFKQWVLEHPEIKTVIASGRQYFTLRDDFPDIADRLTFIAENGGLVYENNKLLYSNAMSADNIRMLLELVQKLPGVTPIICGAQSAYMQPADSEAVRQAKIYYHHLQFLDNLYSAVDIDEVVKIALFIEDFQAAKLYDKLKLPNEDVVTVLSGDSWIDVANTSISKGAALTIIQKSFGLTRSECMGFGDYLNDYTLLQSCEESYCMANGHAALKAISKHTTLSNDEDGVMVVLREL